MGRKLKRFLAREDLRRHPVRGVWRRIAWRVRWCLFDEPWIVRSDAGLPLLVPHSGAGALIYFQGFSEVELTNFLMRYLRPGMVFADVGAHLGEYTILAAALLKNSGRVHAFEASAETFEILRENIELNRFENVVAQPWAVWKENGFCEFEKSPEPSTSALRPGHAALQGGHLARVQAIALDTYFKNFEPSAPALIKIDVEGAELQVLHGAKSLLSARRAPGLIVEYSPRNAARFGYSADEVCSFLRGVGYALFQWQGAEGLVPIQGSPLLEVTQDSCNLVALKTSSDIARTFAQPNPAPVLVAS